MFRIRRWGLVLLIGLLATAPADGRVLRVEVDRRVEVLGGQSFGPRGAYELIEGRIYFAVDPARRRGVGLVEVSNRGGKFTLPYFNDATAALDPSAPAAFGDGLLLEKASR